jgi:dTDP-4-amino-4,6-dideoxygalactose transaminase
MPLYRGGRAPGLPVTETLGRQIITLPISASMQLADVDYVCDHLSELVT